MKSKNSPFKYNKIRNIEILYELPKDILWGIYSIETKYRHSIIRICEYIYLFSMIFLNFIFKRPVKNITIGQFQIGIVNILNYYGADMYRHLRYIELITYKELCSLIRGTIFKNNLLIATELVNNFYNISKQKCKNTRHCIIHTGQLYNGRYAYGLLLLDYCNTEV